HNTKAAVHQYTSCTKYKMLTKKFRFHQGIADGFSVMRFQIQGKNRNIKFPVPLVIFVQM
ncbi:MAG: hypothetical protein IJQ21_10170, partial [Lachnospiraceae bacterium]|nr:hypothetical protein [Lachnospiraceae bacterium]